MDMKDFDQKKEKINITVNAGNLNYVKRVIKDAKIKLSNIFDDLLSGLVVDLKNAEEFKKKYTPSVIVKKEGGKPKS